MGSSGGGKGGGQVTAPVLLPPQYGATKGLGQQMPNLYGSNLPSYQGQYQAPLDPTWQNTVQMLQRRAVSQAPQQLQQAAGILGQYSGGNMPSVMGQAGTQAAGQSLMRFMNPQFQPARQGMIGASRSTQQYYGNPAGSPQVPTPRPIPRSQYDTGGGQSWSDGVNTYQQGPNGQTYSTMVGDLRPQGQRPRPPSYGGGSMGNYQPQQGGGYDRSMIGQPGSPGGYGNVENMQGAGGFLASLFGGGGGGQQQGGGAMPLLQMMSGQAQAAQAPQAGGDPMSQLAARMYGPQVLNDPQKLQTAIKLLSAQQNDPSQAGYGASSLNWSGQTPSVYGGGAANLGSDPSAQGWNQQAYAGRYGANPTTQNPLPHGGMFNSGRLNSDIAAGTVPDAVKQILQGAGWSGGRLNATDLADLQNFSSGGGTFGSAIENAYGSYGTTPSLGAGGGVTPRNNPTGPSSGNQGGGGLAESMMPKGYTTDTMRQAVDYFKKNPGYIPPEVRPFMNASF